MSGAREATAETVMGTIVLVLTVAFLTYSLSVGGVHISRGNYEIGAKFGEAGALAPGAAVSVAGVKVGTVSQVTLDPKTYMAIAKLSIDTSVKLPADSTAKITSDGLLGGAHIAIAPGASLEDLQPGGEIENTQGAVDLLGLIGSVIRPQGGSGEAVASSAPAPPNQPSQPAERH
ncbi:outer membrane lipid asymmetry maintenance protein MlaD [Caulobacter zeae]|uniref:Outer membrane lipid asymmetry maintenance protein MlaD n=2 Tax=Caulobacter TaxID=75 RepID=A0A2T9JEM9_9CAUL|nr:MULTISPECIES: outer membrane lipid asymmetry maintenance protein MlaD [Caulobacter]PLR22662.1 outer membrane lipid asymmetry maintenance protein MlaD [Caulobacter zeae]PVM82119.1 outer membrane lipid asymmetry maintenance protein MlaD [Caulobacter endophyticus]